MALKDSLISHWKLDEASGNAIDAHGSNTLTDNGSVGSTTGKIGNARNFSGSNWLSRADNTDLSMGDVDCCGCFWLKVDDLLPGDEGGGAWTPFAKDDRGTNREYGIYYGVSADRLNFYVFGSASGGDFHQATANNFGGLSTGAWMFVQWRHDASGNSIGIRVNSGSWDTTSHSAGIYDGAAAFGIGDDGANVGLGRALDGQIDEFSIWKGRVLSDSEFNEIYNSGNGLDFDSWDPAPGGLIWYFREPMHGGMLV